MITVTHAHRDRSANAKDSQRDYGNAGEDFTLEAAYRRTAVIRRVVLFEDHNYSHGQTGTDHAYDAVVPLTVAPVTVGCHHVLRSLGRRHQNTGHRHGHWHSRYGYLPIEKYAGRRFDKVRISALNAHYRRPVACKVWENASLDAVGRLNFCAVGIATLHICLAHSRQFELGPLRTKETRMLSPHEFTTLMLVKQTPDEIELDRAELRTLLERQLVIVELLASGH